MTSKNHIPQNTYDVLAIGRLNELPFEAVRKDVPKLLEWLQDAHWDVAVGIACYLNPYVNEMKQELLCILNSDDGMWKYCTIILLIAKSKNKLDQDLIDALERIVGDPSKIEIEDTVVDVAKAVLSNRWLSG